MDIIGLPMEERLLLAFARFASQKGGTIDIQPDDPSRNHYPSSYYLIMYLPGQSEIMTLEICAGENSLFEGPVHLFGEDSITGSLYAEFCQIMGELGISHEPPKEE